MLRKMKEEAKEEGGDGEGGSGDQPFFPFTTYNILVVVQKTTFFLLFGDFYFFVYLFCLLSNFEYFMVGVLVKILSFVF